MRFFRGMSVQEDRADEVAGQIRQGGLTVSPEAAWKIAFFDRRDQLEHLREKEDLTINDTRNDYAASDSFICACGGEAGAAYYALHHNRHGEATTPLLITFSADIDDTYIDGRDCLYSLFQCGRSPERADVLRRFFGRAALRYAERAWDAPSRQQRYRVAMCDLACQDPEVIAEHYLNRVIFEGRYNTRFESAFLIRCPVPAARIESVVRPEPIYDFAPAFRIYDLPRPLPYST